MDDVALTSSLAGGGAQGLLGVHDAFAEALHGYAWFLLAGGSPDGDRWAAADGPAGAAGVVFDAAGAAGVVFDALLVAAGAVRDLAEPGRLRPWLYALTRNECLRRGSGVGPDPRSEAAELAGRHRLAPADIGAVLGLSPAHAGRLAAAGTATDPLAPPPLRQGAPAPGRAAGLPVWVRGELAAAAGPDGAARRAELTRRARPFDPDGFPVPLDRRRLSGRALAWSAALVVLLALALLITLPASGEVGVVTAGSMLAAAGPLVAQSEVDTQPLPTLRATPFGEPRRPGASAPRPQPAPDRGADRRPASPRPSPTGTLTPEPTPAVTVRTDADRRSPVRTDADRRSPVRTDADRRSPALWVSWSRRPAVRCADGWTAELRVRTPGADGVGRVEATVRDPGQRRTVALGRDGEGWRAELPGLPTGRTVTVTVRADGGAAGVATRRIAHSC